MDIRDVLRDDHRQMQELAAHICESTDPLQTKKLFFQFKELLTRHSRAEERVVYTALSGTEEQEAMTLACEGGVEHGLVDRLLQQNTRGRADNVEWRARMKVIREMLDHHVEDEERAIFDALGRLFDHRDLEKMGERFEEHKERVQLVSPRGKGDDPHATR